MRHERNLVAVILIVLMTSGCALAPKADPVPRIAAKTETASISPLVVGFSGPPGKISPFSESPASDVIARLCYPGLTRVGANDIVSPELAESWSLSEDRKTLSITLRQDAAWSDGSPITADDVLFTLGALIDPRSPFLESEKWESRKVSGAGRRVIITLDRPDDWLLYDLAIPVLPRAAFADKKPGEWTYLPGMVPPVVSGPYLLKSVSPSDTSTTLLFAPNTKAQARRPQALEVQVKFYSRQYDLVAEVESGKVQYARLQAPTSEVAIANPAVLVKSIPRDSFASIVFNCGKKAGKVSPFSDPVLRQAISIVARATASSMGEQTVMHVELPNSIAQQASPSKGPTTPDAFAEAEDILSRAGYRRQGGQWKRDGRSIEFDLVTPAYDPMREKYARMLAQSLKEFGIRMNVVQDEAQVFGVRANPSFNFDAILMGWSLSTGAGLWELLHSSSVPRLDAGTIKVVGGQNVMQYRSAEMDRALEAYRPEKPEDERLEAARAIRDILRRDVPLVPVYAYRDIVLRAKSVVDKELDAISMTR